MMTTAPLRLHRPLTGRRAAAPARGVAPAAPVPSAPAPSALAVVVIPALEPGTELVELVDALVDQGSDVLVIDDGSGPAYAVTFDRCEVLGATVVHLRENRGKGFALREALRVVEAAFPGRGVVTADADGQHTLGDIRRVQERLAADEDDGDRAGIVLGVRSFARGEVPLRSWFGNLVSAELFQSFAGVRLGDTQTGLRGIPARHLEWAGTLPGDRYEYEYTMLVQAARAGIELVQVPIETIYVDENATSHFRPLRDSLRVLAPVLGFAGTGLASFALDTALFLGFSALGAEIWLALGLARVLSGGMNFTLNRHLVFRGGRRTPLGAALVRYVVLAGVVLAGGVLLVDTLAAIGLPLVVAKVGVDLLLFAVSYLVQRLVVFRGR